MGSATSASLTTWQVCHGRHVARMATIICSPYRFLHSPRSLCTTRPGEAKSSPERGSFVAFQRTNRTSGRAANELRAYEDPQITNLGVGRSNRSGRASQLVRGLRGIEWANSRVRRGHKARLLEFPKQQTGLSVRSADADDPAAGRLEARQAGLDRGVWFVRRTGAVLL
jgi:hypothetical protein